MKTAFLILGAQRSGTSVTSHVLSQLGVDFGCDTHFIRFEHNPIFFELDWVNHYNNQLIQALGYRYTDFFLPIESDFVNANTQAIENELRQHIVNEWQDQPLIGIKDPRISLTFPIWQKLLAETYDLKIILVFRHPSGFLKSNQKLFHNWENWDRTRHLRFWLQLNLSAAYLTRNLPQHYVNYDRLMQDPFTVTTELANVFNLDNSSITDAAEVVERAYYHHETLAPTNDPLAEHCYDLLCSSQLMQIDYLSYRRELLSYEAEYPISS